MEILGVIIGVLMITFNRKCAHFTIETQNRTWGFHFGKAEETFTRVLAIVVGLGFVTVDILAIAGIVTFRR